MAQGWLDGVKLYPSQTSGVTHGKVPTVDKHEREPVIGGQWPVAAVAQFSDAGCTVNNEPTGHAEAKPEHRPVGSVSSVGTGSVEQQELAPSAGGDQVASYQDVQGGGDQAPLQVPGIGSLDYGYGTP
jgi:hypothetical protein